MLRRIPTTTHWCRDREGLMLEEEGVVVVAHRRRNAGSGEQ
jgi:hypothetical protein